MNNKKLADVAKIGDYVNIGIHYRNVQWGYNFEDPQEIEEVEGPIGWKILSKEDNGTIKLISSGIPLVFKRLYRITQEFLNDILNKPDVKGNIISGFIEKEWKELFKYSKCIDTSKRIHAFGVEDGVEKMKKENDNYIWLLKNGFSYIVNNYQFDLNNLWEVGKRGFVRKIPRVIQGENFCAVRLVVSLKKDIKISESNIGDGSSFRKSWLLEGVELKKKIIQIY